MNSYDSSRVFFYLPIYFNTEISLWICIVHNCLRNKSTRNAFHYSMQISIHRVWSFFFQSLVNVQYYIHVFALYSIGFEEEILQYGGGHERKDPSILQGSSTQLHRNWPGINLWFIIKCLYFINQSCIWYLVISII